MFLEICMQIHSVVFAWSRENNKKKYAKTVNLLCAANKAFVKYQAQGAGFNPNLPCVRPCLYPFALFIDFATGLATPICFDLSSTHANTDADIFLHDV